VAGGEGGKKNDATVPIVIGIGVLLFLLLFGGCGNISLPTYGPSTGGYGGSHGSHYNGQRCDRSNGGGDCRAGDGGGDDRGGSGHERRHPRATDDPDRSPEPSPRR
jgi:hypothetical protein